MLNKNHSSISIVTKWKHRLVLSISALALLIPAAGFCGRDVNSFPFSETFDNNNYQDLIWTTGGAVHEWVASQGWQGSGAAKFYPNTIKDNVMGLGQFTHFNNGQGAPQVNVRFLIYYGSEWNPGGHQNKVLIFNRPVLPNADSPEDASLRTMLASYGDDPENPSWRSFGVCEFVSGCSYENGGNWPDGTDSFKITNPPLGRTGEWISVEVESSNITGKIRVYISTQDGEFSGLYAEHDLTNTQYPIRMIDMIGGYNNDAAISSPDNFYIIDELAMDTSYIGPPEGFVGGTNPNPTPEPLPENSYTILNPALVSGGVISLVDNNTITAAGKTLHLDQYETGIFSATNGSELSQGMVVSGTGPFEFGSNTPATDIPAHNALAGTQFVMPHNRYAHQYYMVSQEGDADVTVSLEGVLYQLHLQHGVPQYFDGGIDNSISAIITSDDTPILVTHRGDPVDGFWYADVSPVPPAARELWGFRSYNAVIGAVEDNTHITIYASDGSVGHATLNAGQKRYVNVGNKSAQGQGAAIHLVADRPIGAVQIADGDGADQTAFYPTALLKRRFGLPRNAQYIAVACPETDTTVTLHNGTNPPVNQTCDANGDYPGKAYFGSSTNGVHIQAGAYLESNKPVHVIYEDASSNDEHNLIGANGGTSASPLFSATMEGASPARDWLDARTAGADGASITFPFDGESQVAQFNYHAGSRNEVWLRHNFGSHILVNEPPVDELWINFEYLVSDMSIFNPNAGRESKILLVNWGNPDRGNRTFQVILGAVQDAGSHKFSLEWTKLNRENGSWSGVSSWLTDFSSMPLPENEKLYLQLHIRNSTNGQENGLVQLFNNGQLIMERRNVALNDSYGDHPDHFILSPYITDANGLADGYTQYDNVSLYDTDPGPFTRP